MSFGTSFNTTSSNKPTMNLNYFNNSAQNDQDLLEYQKMLERNTITTVIAPAAVAKKESIMQKNKKDERNKIETIKSEVQEVLNSFSEAAAGKSATAAKNAITEVVSSLEKVETL